MMVKKCFNINTLEEKKIFYISNNENILFLPCEKNLYNNENDISDETLKKIYNFVGDGFKIYNDYVVFNLIKDNVIVGDFNYWEEEDMQSKKKYPCFQCSTLKGKKGDREYSTTKFDISSNIIKEYFLFLKNKENNWGKIKFLF